MTSPACTFPSIRWPEQLAPPHPPPPDAQATRQRGYQGTAGSERLRREDMRYARACSTWPSTDPLTQLPNRRQLFMHLTAAIARAEAGGSHLGVFFLDLDNFKNINDSMGHAASVTIRCLARSPNDSACYGRPGRLRRAISAAMNSTVVCDGAMERGRDAHDWMGVGAGFSAAAGR